MPSSRTRPSGRRRSRCSWRTSIGRVSCGGGGARRARRADDEKTRRREDEKTRRREGEKARRREGEKARRREGEKTRRRVGAATRGEESSASRGLPGEWEASGSPNALATHPQAEQHHGY